MAQKPISDPQKNRELRPKVLPTRDQDSEDVLIYERFRPVLVFFLGVMFLLVGGFLIAVAVAVKGDAAWPMVGVMFLFGGAFVLASLACWANLLIRLLYGEGPPIIALREEGFFDYRTNPPFVMFWKDIVAVDASFTSVQHNTEIKQLLVTQGGGICHKIDLRLLNISVWKLKNLVSDRMTRAENIVLLSDGNALPSPRLESLISEASNVRRSVVVTPEDSDILIASFPYRPPTPVKLLTLALATSFLIATKATKESRTDVALIVAVVGICIILGEIWYAFYSGVGRIKVFEHGIRFCGYTVTGRLENCLRAGRCGF